MPVCSQHTGDFIVYFIVYLEKSTPFIPTILYLMVEFSYSSNNPEPDLQQVIIPKTSLWEERWMVVKGKPHFFKLSNEFIEVVDGLGCFRILMNFFD